jgi:hypothetical protein
MYACVSLHGQPAEGEITLYTYRKWDKERLVKNNLYYNFDAQGNILDIYSYALERLIRGPVKPYFAKYEYSDEGKLLKEQLFQGVEEGYVLLRTTNYHYSHDTLSVTVREKDAGDLLSEMTAYRDGDRTLVKVGMDRLISAAEHFNNEVEYNYDKGRLVSLTSRDTHGFILRITVRYEKNKALIKGVMERDTVVFSYNEFRFYDKSGRLTKIAEEDDECKWYLKIHYGKRGLISGLTLRGEMAHTHEKLKVLTIFNPEFSNNSCRCLSSRNPAVKKINEEIINMYYPITGRASSFNYFDSRRFISFFNQ